MFCDCYYYYYLHGQIRQHRKLEDGSVNIVARGQQRFRLKRRWVDVERLVSAIKNQIRVDFLSSYN